MLDLRPAAQALGALVADIPEERLGAPTPCPDYSVGDLLDHVHGLSIAFTAAARKETLPGADGPSGDARRLPATWREDIPTRLEELAGAWRDPSAWTGATQAGGIDLPAKVAGLVALDELVVHGWDLARACGFAMAGDPLLLDAVHDFVAGVGDDPASRDGLFGPVVPVPVDAPLIDRIVGLAGRDPRWTPPR
ncbi:TIGR03086 family metal-binding protein [Actinomarinicola tropica]|uniref:TIGR03086 family protein n=1 Tax=Actinomarinicola tropica TaxID=2789776 RepID=A0A5Q2RKR5_9ACTN|nr:TIGR03086 family metal-binding protein [Actinomarinicola tropica]QGG96423.1 TIGR03086 family protein [Actinomarinicola tropica]